MKTLTSILAIILILILSYQISSAKTPEKTILVQAQGKVIHLNTADVSYLKSVCHNIPMINALNSLRVIKNNDTADLIITIITNKK